jgi:hypothetical protein
MKAVDVYDPEVEEVLEAPKLPIVLVDMDGTLADVGHRLHHLQHCKICGFNGKFLHDQGHNYQPKKNWPAFFAACDQDAPIEVVAKWVRALPPDYEVWIVSGRPRDLCHDKTVAWLEKHGIPYERLLMRAGGDMRPDDVVKQELLDEWVPKERVKFVIDDRASVCEMWRRNGLTVYQVAEGNF